MRTRQPRTDLADFPTSHLDAGQSAYRVYLHIDPATGQQRTPLHFASVPRDPYHGGRYDLPADRGACYVATDIVTCVLEIAADQLEPDAEMQLLSSQFLRARRRTEATAERPFGPLAALDDPRVFGWGIAGDVYTTDDRPLTQGWAAVFDLAGLAGVDGHARTPPAGDARTITLFGDAGPRSSMEGFVIARPSRLDDDGHLLGQLERYGVHVLPIPRDVPTE